jgi:hypothetical protein
MTSSVGWADHHHDRPDHDGTVALIDRRARLTGSVLMFGQMALLRWWIGCLAAIVSGCIAAALPSPFRLLGIGFRPT